VNEIEIGYPFILGNSDHTTLFDLHNKRCKRQYESEMDKGLLKNEWIHVELKLEDYWNFFTSEEEKIQILRSAQIGIHLWKEKSNTEEQNVVFTDPYKSSGKYVGAS